jgi:archaellum biogenesis ATPase FlaH
MLDAWLTCPFRDTGLDARAAAIVMRTVRNTVDTGRTVVCTIHQPSIDIFEVCWQRYVSKACGSAACNDHKALEPASACPHSGC